jgi:hypothetical protein
MERLHVRRRTAGAAQKREERGSGCEDRVRLNRSKRGEESGIMGYWDRNTVL